MKIKLKKEKINEVVAAAAAVVAIGFVLVLALAAIYKGLGPILQRGDKKLKEADEKIKKAGETLPNKDAFMQEYEAAKQQLLKKADELKKSAQNKDQVSKITGRPSTLIALEIKKVYDVIKKQISENPDFASKLDGADKDLLQVYNDVASLDYIVLLSSTKEKDGFFMKVLNKDQDEVIKKLKNKLLEKPENMLSFGQLLAAARKHEQCKLPQFKKEDSDLGDTEATNPEAAKEPSGEEAGV